jgi:hypothetical protein
MQKVNFAAQNEIRNFEAKMAVTQIKFVAQSSIGHIGDRLAYALYYTPRVKHDSSNGAIPDIVSVKT